MAATPFPYQSNSSLGKRKLPGGWLDEGSGQTSDASEAMEGNVGQNGFINPSQLMQHPQLELQRQREMHQLQQMQRMQQMQQMQMGANAHYMEYPNEGASGSGNGFMGSLQHAVMHNLPAGLQRGVEAIREIGHGVHEAVNGIAKAVHPGQVAALHGGGAYERDGYGAGPSRGYNSGLDAQRRYVFVILVLLWELVDRGRVPQFPGIYVEGR